MVTFAGHAYPWDVNGDPGFADRVRDHGLETVVLAAAYHVVRASTPLHPSRRVVDASHAALYRPAVRFEGALQPAAAAWLPEPDPFGQAANTLRDKGLRVEAWIVLTHNSRLGRMFPELSVVNCYGERYPYALCPAWPEVREYAHQLTVAALRDVEVDGVSLEACGQLGVAHTGHHEKTFFSAEEHRVLSVCCCDACQRAWTARGLDGACVIAALRSGIVPEILLEVRQSATDALRAEVLDAVPAGLKVTLHGHPDPWETGSSPGLTPSAAREVASVLVPAWSTDPGTAELVRRVDGLVGAYLTVLPPADPDDVVNHARRLVSAGAQRLNLYHLGLAGAERLTLLSRIVSALSEGRP